MSYDELTAKLLREKEQQAARIEQLETRLEKWIEALDALRKFEDAQPNNSGREWRQLRLNCQAAETDARAALGEKD